MYLNQHDYTILGRGTKKAAKASFAQSTKKCKHFFVSIATPNYDLTRCAHRPKFYFSDTNHEKTTNMNVDCLFVAGARIQRFDVIAIRLASSYNIG